MLVIILTILFYYFWKNNNNNNNPSLMYVHIYIRPTAQEREINLKII